MIPEWSPSDAPMVLWWFPNGPLVVPLMVPYDSLVTFLMVPKWIPNGSLMGP